MPFVKCSLEEVNAILNANIKSLTMITYVVMNGMLQRNRGLILNLSAFSGLYPVPFISVYSASKVRSVIKLSLDLGGFPNIDEISLHSGVSRVFFSFLEHGMQEHQYYDPVSYTWTYQS